MGSRMPATVLTLACWLLGWILLTAGQQAGVVHLTADTFEHQTQAATGQTTGNWLVLFAHGKDARAQELGNWWARAAQMFAESELPLRVAHVDLDAAPALEHRFKFAKAPAVYLFAHRQMYEYKGELGGELEALRDFALAGYEKEPVHVVPLEVSLPTLLEYFQKYAGGVSPALALGAGIALALLVRMLRSFTGSANKRD